MAKKVAKSVAVRMATASSSGKSTAAEGHRWTFLTNHAHALILLAHDPSIVLREVAVRIGITERAVQRIVADLADGGFLEVERIGRKNHYRILGDRPLRHPIEAHHTIGELLDLIRSGT
jgi:predicted transcriptional regulator